jgi:hypothetical protein
VTVGVEVVVGGAVVVVAGGVVVVGGGATVVVVVVVVVAPATVVVVDVVVVDVVVDVVVVDVVVAAAGGVPLKPARIRAKGLWMTMPVSLNDPVQPLPTATRYRSTSPSRVTLTDLPDRAVQFPASPATRRTAFST